MPPRDAYLPDGDAAAPPERDRLGIPGKPVLSAVGQDLPPDRTMGRLCATLRVVDAWRQREAEKPVEGLPKQLAHLALALDQTRRHNVARSNGEDRCACCGADDAFELVEGCRQ